MLIYFNDNIWTLNLKIPCIILDDENIPNILLLNYIKFRKYPNIFHLLDLIGTFMIPMFIWSFMNRVTREQWKELM